jgi:hypothetical protein
VIVSRRNLHETQVRSPPRHPRSDGAQTLDTLGPIPRCCASNRAAGSAPNGGISDNNRKAKYYSLTKSGRKQLRDETEDWERMSAIINRVLEQAG